MTITTAGREALDIMLQSIQDTSEPFDIECAWGCLIAHWWCKTHSQTVENLWSQTYDVPGYSYDAIVDDMPKVWGVPFKLFLHAPTWLVDKFRDEEADDLHGERFFQRDAYIWLLTEILAGRVDSENIFVEPSHA